MKRIFSKPKVLVLLLVLAGLAPFAGKAFHIDDPLYLWTARQIHAHPLDCYGFEANWFGRARSVTADINNPPLVGYYLALAAALAGWSEVALHLALLLPALVVGWATLALARRHCPVHELRRSGVSAERRPLGEEEMAALCRDAATIRGFEAQNLTSANFLPLLAAAATIVTPAFLVSGTTLMCDMLMLAWWMVGLVCWERGLERHKFSLLACAGVCAGLATLTKYNGITLVPLLLLYALVRQRRLGAWLLALVIPVLMVGGYEWLTRKLYGQGLFLGAAGWATTSRSVWKGNLAVPLLTGLSFTGGCLLSGLFLAPLLWSRRALLLGVGLVLVCLVAVRGALGGAPWWTLAQGAVFVAGGVGLLALAVADWWRARDAVSLLLAAWVLGTFVFAAAVNWTVNGRGILPMAPAVGLLIARRLGRKAASGQKAEGRGQRAEGRGQRTEGRGQRTEDRGRQGAGGLSPLGFSLLAVPAAVVALAVTWADYSWANSARTAARAVCARHNAATRAVWFQGHWGFQYYMEQGGAKAVDQARSLVQEGEVVVIPGNNCNVLAIPPEALERLEVLALTPNRWLTTMHPDTQANFYAGQFGLLPFAFGPVPPERYIVYRAVKPIQFRMEASAAETSGPRP